MALEQGKEVFVVPGRITDELSKGCDKLLWEGATPAISPEKVLENLYGMHNEENSGGEVYECSRIQKHILSFLEVTPLHINVLQQKTGLHMDILTRELLLLILEDKVIQVGTQWYQKSQF